MKKISVGLAVLLLVLPSAASPQSSVQNIDLGTLGGASSAAIDVNDRGNVVGWAATSLGERHAVLWTVSAGVWTAVDLGTLGGTESAAWYINERGQVAGIGRIATGETHAFWWTARTGMMDITDVEGYDYCSPTGLNERGLVIGRCEKEFLGGSPEDFAFAWSAETGLVRIENPAGGRTHVYGVNLSGEVTGSTEAVPEPWGHAMRWSATGGMVDLGAPFGGYTSVGFDINDRGQIVGSSRSSSWLHAVLWNRDGSAIDLPALGATSWATASLVNGRGQILGWASEDTSRGPEHAVLWTGDVFPFMPLVDLGAVPGAALPVGLNDFAQALLYDRVWTDECVYKLLDGSLVSAYAINSGGQIVGISQTAAGTFHASLWSVPPLAAQSWDAALRGKVKCLARLGTLPKDEQPVLLVKIKNAAWLSAQGDPAGACSELDSFVALVKQLVLDLALTPRQGQELAGDAVTAARAICGG
jgi:probable HAF family extracellular repeat protein